MGDTGPDANYRASDLEVQSLFGHWQHLGENKFHRGNDAPLRLGVPVGALNSAVFAFQGITAALLHRRKTGQGQKVMISEAASLIAMKNIQFAAESEPDEYEGHNVDHLHGPMHSTKTKDRDICWGAPTEVEDIAKLVEAVGLGHLLQDPKFQGASLRAEVGGGMMGGGGGLKTQIEERFRDMTAEEASNLIRSCNGAAVYHNTFAGVASDPQAIAMGMTAEFEHPTAGAVDTTSMPWLFTNDTLKPGSPPILGQHTHAVLRGLGMQDADIGKLEARGAIRQAADF